MINPDKYKDTQPKRVNTMSNQSDKVLSHNDQLVLRYPAKKLQQPVSSNMKIPTNTQAMMLPIF
jgi:hypothetical protein